MSRAQEYKAMAYEELEVPSGKTFTVVEPPLTNIIEFLSAIGVDLSLVMSDNEDAQKSVMDQIDKIDFNSNLIAVLEHLVPACCVDPVVVISNAGPDELNLTDIKRQDLIALSGWVASKLQIDRQGMQDQSFPDK